MMNSIAEWAKNIAIIDESEILQSVDPMRSFAKDELLCRAAAQQKQSICRIWRHPNAFILGQQDARLPNAKEAAEWLSSKHYMSIVRNSGGAAVPLDEGVVNISLIFPTDEGKPTKLSDDFEKMYQLIAAALSYYSEVQKGEIEGAYCPGDYDLSIHGLKFCGIAQRRLLQAYSVQAFVVASGNGNQRADLVRQFYNIAAGGDAHLKHPIVTVDSTASLEELTSLVRPVHTSFVHAIIGVLQKHGGEILTRNSASASLSALLPTEHEITEMAQKLHQRYQHK